MIGTIELYYQIFKDVPVADIAQLLCTILSAPSIEAVTFTYDSIPTDRYSGEDSRPGSPVFQDLIDVPPPAPSLLGGSRCTDLRELHLHWDHLSLPWISALLHLPRNLEVLHLQINPVNALSHRPIHLNPALRPVADTLRELTLYPRQHRAVFSHQWTWLDDFHVQWGPDGLRIFGKLEFLGLPTSSWTPWRLRPVLPGHVLLPKSLRTFHITGARLVRSRPNDRNVLSEEDPDGVDIFTVDYLSGMSDVDRLLEGTPLLRYIQVTVSGWLDACRIREQMPRVRLPKLLVDHGIKILAQLPEGDKLELETCI